eukprot:TRINITY_DN2518_c0_g1::TRINITY_DN2518_c0_g1_i1::g.19327::m.19327 TRINITY_DN2518_c0_g1::TRINITY_DN2518_c0_g1_i1::g.19327  ORF type:complete len:821 (-),score=262.11,sp/Q9SJT7/VHAA2_ARATH/45.57/0.0,V_ATPase_I/PF01496.14/3.8e-259,Vps5/PF09325.5/0.0081,Vps5/PF09325.5/2.8,DUF2216/PF10226.4/0.052,DUF106/PF01956.11/0.49,MutS_III/PF05192.13/1.8e+02,MutS_III/PF05192.13/2.4,CHASE3/PF05227.8/87,CHASE3/PF05227.8/1.8,Sec34/PF04136.10/0.36,Sec34/PF04136.10/3.2e+03,TMPIT/PF07851.8/2e+02,TMPIT/PF07851.8/0.38 TRI
MVNLFRSQEMQLVQVFVQRDAAHDTVDELGELGLIQFKDLNEDKTAFQRSFVTEVRRCEEMERKLRYFMEQITKLGVEPYEDAFAPQEHAHSKVEELAVYFDQLEQELRTMSQYSESLIRQRNELVELKYVLEKASTFFDENHTAARAQSHLNPIDGGETAPLLQDSGESSSKSSRLGFVTGVVPTEKCITFERVIFRATRGNVFLRFSHIDDPLTDPQSGGEVKKSVFVVFYSGDRAREKILKIAESFSARRYPFSENPVEQRESYSKLLQQLSDVERVVAKSTEHQRRQLRQVADSIEQWTTLVKKEKAVYHCLNKFNYDTSRKCLIGEGWCPVTAKEDIQFALRRATARSGAEVPSFLQEKATQDTPPTYFKTNDFTAAFQDIVDSYGIARYQELNPTPYNIITFPFLFAVMFGDLGHGLLMTMAASYLIYKAPLWKAQKTDENTSQMLRARYLLLFMGIFSMYTGFLYNEFFAVPMDFFGSKWEYYGDNEVASGKKCEIKGIDGELEGDECDGYFPTEVYPVGMDPVWKGTDNGLTFTNSLKMKMSVIMGVLQMTVGVILSYFNARYFRRPLNVWFEFVPQFLFLQSIFGYLCIMIFIKWGTNYYEKEDYDPNDTDCYAPDIKQVLIDMFMSPGSWNDDYDRLYSGQETVQVFLVLIAVICMPWMLLCKPLILRYQHASGFKTIGGHGGHDEEEFDFGEVMVHQMIHSIEFILGCISNTASYLRLWALSLAHAQLSDVFLEKILVGTLESGSAVMVFVGAAMWLACTIGVLMLMESLSAFLHALRLHWVEFQNKFYLGDGYKFIPFDYKLILVAEE